MRDSSSEVVAIGDWDGDGRLDVATANGLALGMGGRSFGWQPLPFASSPMPLPALLVPLGGTGLELVRGTATGDVERCVPWECQALPLGGARFPVTELAAADFDRDGELDLLAGRDLEEDYDPERGVLVRGWWWRSGLDYQRPVAIEGMGVPDIEVADVDGDGHADVIAQVVEYISDFPSDTDVWVSTGAGFSKVQTFPNAHNHNEAMTVTDLDEDGWVDRVSTGVDDAMVDVVWGQDGGFGEKRSKVPTARGIGVQVLDLDGDGARELVVRETETGDLVIQALTFDP